MLSCLLALATLAICLPGLARAEEPVSALPSGHWVRYQPGSTEQLEHIVELVLDVGGDDFMFFNFYDRAADKWKPVLVEGSYKIVTAKPGDFRVAFKIDHIERKGISHGRKDVFSQVLKETQQLGITMKPGKTLDLILEFGCAGERERLHVCLRNPAGGKAVCRDLDGEACRGIFKDKDSSTPKPAK